MVIRCSIFIICCGLSVICSAFFHYHDYMLFHYMREIKLYIGRKLYYDDKNIRMNSCFSIANVEKYRRIAVKSNNGYL